MTLPIPRAALAQHTIILGKTGAGKSSVLRLFIEDQLARDEPVCVIDPKGDHWGIKSSADGKQAGYPLVIFGGEHADVPINAHAGAQVAELYATGNRPCLIDLGGWMPGDRTRFFIEFASTLFRHTRGARWLVIDEVHNFAPQGKVMDPDAGKMLHWANRIITEGRGKGVTVLSASQRPQKVHKDFVTSNETLIAMRVIHELDRMAMKAWIDGCGDPEKGKEVLASLAQMKRGEGWVWSPEIGFGPKRVDFPMFSTYDSFKPQATEEGRHPTGWAETNLDEVKAKLATAIEEAEANDPRALRARIAELEREARKARELAVDGDLLEREYERGKADGYAEAAADARVSLEPIANAATQLFAGASSLKHLVTMAQDLGAESANRPRNIPENIPKPPPVRAATRKVQSESRAVTNGALSKAERLILTALAQYPQGRTKNQVAILTGYAVNGGGFGNAISSLRTKAYLEGDAARLVITQGGIAALGQFDPLPEGFELREYWFRQLGKAERKALETQAEYERQIATLRGVFGQLKLDQIAPADVSDYLKARSKPNTNAKGRAVGGAIAATREKALFSAVFNFARASRLTNAANPAVGIRGKKSRSATYVEDGDLARVLEHADQPLADFLELAYRTGADASVVLKFTRADVKDGALWVRRTKTGARIRIDVVGPLQALLARLCHSGANNISGDSTRSLASLYLIRDERGQPFTLGAMRKRFWKARALAGVKFTIRDLRPKAGSDADDLRAANLLLGHADESTTAIYRRKRIGERAKPIMRAIKK